MSNTKTIYWYKLRSGLVFSTSEKIKFDSQFRSLTPFEAHSKEHGTMSNVSINSNNIEISWQTEEVVSRTAAKHEDIYAEE